MANQISEQGKTVALELNGYTIQALAGQPLSTLADQEQAKHDSPIVGAKYNQEVVDLYTKVAEPGSLEFLDLRTEAGLRIYRQSLIFLLTRAVYEMFPKRKVIVGHSLGNSYFCQFKDITTVSPFDLMNLETKMRKLVEANDPIVPQRISVENAVRILAAFGHDEKASLLESLQWEDVVIHSSGSFSNYSYSSLTPGTGILDTFKLEPFNNGFLLRYPAVEDPSVVAPFTGLHKLEYIFRESEEWARILGVSNLAGLISILAKDPGDSNNLINVAEALHEKKIASIADQVYSRRDHIKLILIAGPSSSGKTTFTQRLAIQLRVLGLQSIPISVDNYFVDRDLTPKDERGEYDYESLKAIDLPLFNQQLKMLIERQEIECPVFSFQRGMREEQGKKILAHKNSIIIIEGIHGLNEELTASIARENKYKIYISALTQNSIDYHNRISTTDTRLIRRMVRDNRYRGVDAKQTLSRWPSVRRGEERNIFPYQEDADMMFNSALFYEFCILKKYAQPLLESIQKEDNEFSDAQRLLNLLDHFPEISDSHVPYNSILREFIGNSCFLH